MGFLQTNGIEALPQFLTSLSIGLLIGLERERNPSARAGLRTFALVAVFGTLSALLSENFGTPWFVIAGMLAVAGMIIAAYLNHPQVDGDPGTTTIIALLLCYGLGAIIWLGLTKLAIMLAIGVTILLYFKPELQGITQRLSRSDLVAVLQFSVLTFVVLPILPDQSYGPYNAFNPHQAWLMVVLISGISLAGYAAMHTVGTRYGAPLLGFLGGIASSTATTLIYAKNSKSNVEMLHLAASVIVIAGMVVLLRLTAITAAVAYGALAGLLPILAGGFASGFLVVLYNWRKMKNPAKLFIPETSNPAELHTAIGFGLIYVIVLLCSSWMKDIAGSQGLYAVAFVSGLTDVDAITISSLHLNNLGQLSEQQTITTIAIAILANLAFKFGMVAFVGGWKLAKLVSAGFGAIAVGVLVGLIAL
ncbi:MAG: MgtC/SapB family protein [Gallionella sp.]